MNDLMTLWKSRIGAIVGIVRAGETEHREVANMAAQVGADYHGRFIVELLQNASDQAWKAGLEQSTVTIVRTAEIIAVANEGTPFTEPGLRSITSLGLSTKDPQDAIGNKGIGFKSVFQVSECPEVYSSSAGTASFADSPGLMFKMSLTPFEDAQYETIVRDMIAEQLSRVDHANESLTADDLLSEIKAAAPFKFPLPLSPEDLNDRLLLMLERPPGQTLVVLPLRQTPETLKTVETAIDELSQEAGAAILFLPGVSSIRVIDRVRGFVRKIIRNTVHNPRVIRNYGALTTVVTGVGEDATISDRTWRVISRRMGAPDVVSEDQAAKEGEAIRKEARKLPGTNWDTVRTSPVSVAIPLPPNSAATESLLLEAHGRICIGLPTKDPTGTPAWINAHFYGTISRTGIDLIENSYNALLFDECIRLHEAMIADLKKDSDTSVRRTATLAFERANGPLAAVLYAADGQAYGDVILSPDGLAYQRPRETLLPEAGDVDALLQMLPQPSEAVKFGVKLPDAELAQRARPLIEALIGGISDPGKVGALLTDRSRTGISIIEYAAKTNRAAGPDFWASFLAWVVKRLPPDVLNGQEFLPVGRDALAKPSERVFLPPSSRRASDGGRDADDEIAELPADLAKSLRFLDDAAVTVRKPDSRDLTELAAKLSPDTGRGLVRRPRLDDLINDAVGPLMQLLKNDPESRQTGMRLLRQAIDWLWELSDMGRERLTRDALRVPVLMADKSWAWVPPSSVYFGPEWLSEPLTGLLQEAYGHDPHRLLVPWVDFARDLGIPIQDQDDWIGAMELLGVSRSPKRVRPRPGPRIAPLASVSSSELSLSYVQSPIPQAESFWRPYLEATRKRPAVTISSQPFHYRPVIWIDGLEREGSRPAIVRLMLLCPQAYENCTMTSLERQDRPGVDARMVPSLWVHAITANRWKVIPTQHGIVTVTDAWLLDGQQRGLALRRYGLLNQVEAPYDKADRLLQAIGVTTLQGASTSHLLYAIDQLGNACTSFDSETQRTAAFALAEDLFGHLQTSYARNVAPLPSLKTLCLPLERNRQAVGVLGDALSTAYFNDDPVRARFVAGFENALVWPLGVRHAYRDLVAELRRQLGESAVIFTSMAQVDSRFVEDMNLKHVPLLDWLSTTFPQYSVASDIACLIAYTGRQETDPNDEGFNRIWRLFQKSVLVFGSFPPESPTPYFYDRTTQLLQVAADISNAEKVEATWMLVGLSYRDTWSAYGKELEKGTPGRFLADRHISSAQRENVENAIGLSSSERFKHLRAAVLALWFLRHGKQPIELFEQEWNVNARSIRLLCEWIGRTDLADVFAGALGSSEEEAALAIMQAAKLKSELWQEALATLGMAAWRFTHKVKAWRDVGNEVVAILKTCVARSVTASTTDLQPILRDNRFLDPPDEVACRSEGAEEVLTTSLQCGQRILREYAGVAGVELLQRRLASIFDQTKGTLDTVDLDDAPSRDVCVYRDDDEGKRSRDAEARFQGLMTVALALAKLLGEEMIAEQARSDPRVSLLLNGWWANCFCVMVAIQRVLQTKAPKTAQRMSDERVFRDPAPANELLIRFKELTAVMASERPLAPKRMTTVLGRTRTEDDVEKDLLRGTTGTIGQQLKSMAEKQALDTATLNIIRSKVLVPSGKGKTRGSAGGGGPGMRKDKELAGLLGEASVYEHLRLALPGFDERAWRSCNRNLYGLEGAGDDSLGFDFSYRDVEGRLTARSDRPTCCLDVKASSGDGTEPFQMSANEWEKARECHESSNSIYGIIRVAHVRDNPKIIDVVFDPFGLYRAGQLALSTQDMWIYVGVPTDSSQDG